MALENLREVAVAALTAIGEARTPIPQRTRFHASGSDFGEPTPGLEEPVFDPEALDNIQGNVIPGFNKDYQHFLFFKMGAVDNAKQWLRWLAPSITSMDEALAFVRLYRELRDRRGRRTVPIKATWVNLGVSYRAIASLVSTTEADKFGDESFRQGLAERSEFLGDPSSPDAPGNKRNWRFGGPSNSVDFMVIVAADDPSDLQQQVDEIRDEAKQRGLMVVFEQACQTLPDKLRGHEHFGFKDGVSQPGIRGRTSTAARDFVTPRYFKPSDARHVMFGRPGQPLVYPGQFIFGQPRQSTESITDMMQIKPGARSFPAPDWARNGSYVVCRRMTQDVPKFWEFAAEQAQVVGVGCPVKFASMLVGRWPSGAPIMRTPDADNLDLAGDDLANNHFLFDDDSRPTDLTEMHGYAGDTFPQAKADVLGAVCPHFAHIRKVNPRDSATDLGKPTDTLVRLLLRRGIPFGPPLAGVKSPPPELVAQERGLVFVSYQTSIENQFEFVLRRWANSPLQPNLAGHDLVIGQQERYGNRERFADFPAPNGSSARIQTFNEWIISTGGEYFFAPPIRAILEVLGAR